MVGRCGERMKPKTLLSLPIDQWTEQDWCDLYFAMEWAKHRIVTRHGLVNTARKFDAAAGGSIWSEEERKQFAEMAESLRDLAKTPAVVACKVETGSATDVRPDGNRQACCRAAAGERDSD